MNILLAIILLPFVVLAIGLGWIWGFVRGCFSKECCRRKRKGEQGGGDIERPRRVSESRDSSVDTTNIRLPRVDEKESVYSIGSYNESTTGRTPVSPVPHAKQEKPAPVVPPPALPSVASTSERKEHLSSQHASGRPPYRYPARYQWHSTCIGTHTYGYKAFPDYVGGSYYSRYQRNTKTVVTPLVNHNGLNNSFGFPISSLYLQRYKHLTVNRKGEDWQYDSDVDLKDQGVWKEGWSPKRRDLFRFQTVRELMLRIDVQTRKVSNDKVEASEVSLLRKLKDALTLLEMLHVACYDYEIFRRLPLAFPSGLGVDYGMKYLQERQSCPLLGMNSILVAQKLILYQQPREIPTEDNMHVALVIGVDATPHYFGGYCVNLREKKVEFYVVNESSIPWKTVNKGDPAEFEMKNFLFALSVWHKEIEHYKTFSAYTDNLAISQKENKYGCQVNTLMNHFTNCREAVLVNKNGWVNRKKDLATFAQYIRPADDLSRWEIRNCTDFLGKFYSIMPENIIGTHQEKINQFAAYPLYTENRPYYQGILNTAKEFMDAFECEHCNDNKQLQSSLQGSPDSLEPGLLGSSTVGCRGASSVRRKKWRKTA